MVETVETIEVHAPIATTCEVFEEVAARYGVREVSDSVALGIASMWQSPGTVGHVLASFASRRPVSLSDLLEDIRMTRATERMPADDEKALDMLATYAIRRARPSHVNYPHEPGYLYDCPACESSCHCTPGSAECVFEGEHK
jgi:hypothetical protein